MSAWGRLRRWLRLDTDGDGDDLRRYDESERRMEARVRVIEARVEALRLAARREGEELQRQMDGGR